MTIVVCSGINSFDLTQSFLSDLNLINNSKIVVINYPQIELYSPLHLYQFLEQKINKNTPLLFVAFSAGVVGGISSATLWQLMGGKIKAFIAIDGWGVPLVGKFPIYRLSHDYFTHWSSELLGASRESFYAEPAVEHLTIWNSPQLTWGWWLTNSATKIHCTAADFLLALLNQYEEI